MNQQPKMRTIVIAYDVPDDGPRGYGDTAIETVRRNFSNIAFTRNARIYSEPPVVVINVEGGGFQGASSEFPLRLITLDYDTEGSEYAKIVTQAAAPNERAFVEESLTDTRPCDIAWVQEIASGRGVKDPEEP